MPDLIPIERIENKILLIREKKVLLDRDLADLYSVPTKQLKRAVKRNIKRFPEGFMFVLSKKELEDWRCQFGTSNDKFGLRYPPMVFTEQGVAMLSSVLNSERAIQVNIAIIKTFVKMREMLLNNTKLSAKFTELEERLDQHDENTLVIMATLRKLINEPQASKKRKIGFQK